MTTHSDTESLLLPEGTRLVHIGPPKTGTTSLQRAFHGGRDAVRRQGVHYVGPTHQPVGPVLAVTGRTSPISGKPPSRWTWRLLVNEVRRAKEPRVVLSSEFLADARPDAIRTIVGDLGAEQVHVVVTLRPLARIVPSQWQQFVQSGLRQGYDDWLEVMFKGQPSAPTPTFWFRHHHDELVTRWADVVGADNMTVVALDDADHAMVLRVFERLTGLREGTLVADRDVSNRSMTMPEIEVVRAFNELAAAEGLSGPLQAKVMRLGAAAYMKTREPEPDEPPIETPQWALDRSGEVAAGMVERIRASGVRVVGDLDRLTEVPRSGLAGTERPPLTIPPAVAASAAVGVVLASGLARGGAAKVPVTPEAPDALDRDPRAYVPRPSVEPLAVVRLSTVQLAGVLLRRSLAAVGAKLNVVGRRRR